MSVVILCKVNFIKTCEIRKLMLSLVGGYTYVYYYYSLGNAPLCHRLTDESEERVVLLGGHPPKY